MKVTQMGVTDLLGFDNFMTERLVKPVTKPPVKPTPIKRAAMQNDMPYQGSVIIEGTPIDFYGSDKAWERFKSECNA